MIEQIFNQLLASPILMIILGLVAILLVFSFLKKLFKWAFLLVVVGIAILGYIYFTSDQPGKDIQNILTKGQQTIREVKGKAQNVGENLKNRIDDLKKLKSGKK